MVANGLRNVWAYLVIVCGHFTDGAEKFTEAVLEDETKAERYLKQMPGTANFHAGPIMAVTSGNLCYQIEHHLFPDLPSNRYPEVAAQVRALCVTHDLPYTTGPLVRQYLLTVRTACQLALPDRFLSASSDDAPETASENRFRIAGEPATRSLAGKDVKRRGFRQRYSPEATHAGAAAVDHSARTPPNHSAMKRFSSVHANGSPLLRLLPCLTIDESDNVP